MMGSNAPPIVSRIARSLPRPSGSRSRAAIAAFAAFGAFAASAAFAAIDPADRTSGAVLPTAGATPVGAAGRLIAHYKMQRIAREGAWFSLSYASEDRIDGDALPPRYAGNARAAGSAILAVATRRDFSAMHRLRSDEIWHFYGGAPLDMLLLYPDGHGSRVRLGTNVAAGESPQVTVPHGVWQGAMPRGTQRAAYSFFGTQLAPAFDYADFEIGYRDELVHAYPAFARDIARLTRGEFAVRPAASGAGASASAGAISGAGAGNGNGAAETRSDDASPELRGPIFDAQTVPEVTVSPGVGLRELVGRVARDARSASLSVAEFSLGRGRATAMSYNRKSEEVLLVASGAGSVRMNGVETAVHAGSTVFVPPRAAHAIAAAADQTLVFYAISAPAFTPDDYVIVP